MTELVVDSGIDTRRDLLGILPNDVAQTIRDGDDELVAEMQSAAALRILATIKNPAWQQCVTSTRIDWAQMLHQARRQLRESNSVRVRIEAAAGLAGHSGAKPDLLYLARALDRENLLAVIDAIRIVADGGLEP